MKSLITLDEIYAPVQGTVKQVPQEILNILDSGNDLATDVIQYFFSGQGKLLRPALTCLGASLLGSVRGTDVSTGEIQDRIRKVASSFEIFHAATLIHDDIIDSSYLRRNLPTVHIKWDSQTAVLVGDFLHDKAIECIFKTANQDVFGRFLETAGLVCDGEIHELGEHGNFELSEKEYYDIIHKKTAVLLACCIEAGGRMLGATEEEAKALRLYGDYFGLAFQIVDDCLDFTGDEHEFGKTLGVDCVGGVMTLPLIRLLECLDPVKKAEVVSLLKSGGEEKFEKVLQFIREQETVESSVQSAKEFADKARLELEIFPDSAAKQSLIKLLDYVLERKR